jgi:hypothetical protein
MSTYTLNIYKGTEIHMEFCWKNNSQCRKIDEGNTAIGYKVHRAGQETHFITHWGITSICLLGSNSGLLSNDIQTFSCKSFCVSEVFYRFHCFKL